jgi:hypothetical protein
MPDLNSSLGDLQPAGLRPPDQPPFYIILAEHSRVPWDGKPACSADSNVHFPGDSFPRQPLNRPLPFGHLRASPPEAFAHGRSVRWTHLTPAFALVADKKTISLPAWFDGGFLTKRHRQLLLRGLRGRSGPPRAIN